MGACQSGMANSLIFYIVQAGESILSDFFNRSTVGQMQTALSASSICETPQRDEQMKDFLKCQFLKGQRETWEIVGVAFLLLTFLVIILAMVLYRKTVKVVQTYSQRSDQNNVRVQMIAGVCGPNDTQQREQQLQQGPLGRHEPTPLTGNPVQNERQWGWLDCLYEWLNDKISMLTLSLVDSTCLHFSITFNSLYRLQTNFLSHHLKSPAGKKFACGHSRQSTNARAGRHACRFACNF